MIIEAPNFIDADTVSFIKESVNSYIPKDPTYSYNREGKTVNISDTPDLRSLDQKLSNIFLNAQRQIVNFKYRPGYPSGDSGYEYHLYEPGNICHVHADGEFAFTGEKNSSFVRYASVVLHLSTLDDGGELIFPNQNKKVKTEAGKIVVFPPYSMYPHYTTPSAKPREVIVTWFVYSNISAFQE